MRDNNDNNVDDKLEQLALIGGIAHFRGQQQALQQSAKQTEEVRRLREAAERDTKSRKAEESARKAEEGRISALPQCPICGGRLNGQFRKCKHCTSDLSWVEGIPCEPGQESEVQDRLNQERQAEQKRAQALVAEQETLAEAYNKLQAEWLKISVGLPDKCPSCSRFRPGIVPKSVESVQYALNWAASMSTKGCCAVCLVKTGKINNIEMGNEKAKQSKRIGIFATVLMSFIVISFILYSLGLFTPR